MIFLTEHRYKLVLYYKKIDTSLIPTLHSDNKLIVANGHHLGRFIQTRFLYPLQNVQVFWNLPCNCPVNCSFIHSRVDIFETADHYLLQTIS